MPVKSGQSNSSPLSMKINFILIMLTINLFFIIIVHNIYLSQYQIMNKLPSWQVVTEECLEDGWSKEDIASLEGLIAFVNTFEGLGASKEDVRGWIGPAKRKRVVVDVLLDMAVSHSYLVKEDEEMYVGHPHSRTPPVPRCYFPNMMIYALLTCYDMYQQQYIVFLLLV